ncbi:MAG: hypothetical protein GY842_11600 [bacterium]|nr:hypothetical protein [bacterium]
MPVPRVSTQPSEPAGPAPQQSRTGGRSPRPGRHFRWGAFVLAGGLGLAAFFTSGFEYLAAVALTADPQAVSVDDLHGLRRDLLDHAWQAYNPTASRWRVDLDEPGRTLRVRLRGSDPEASLESVEQLAAAFLEHVRGLVEQARSHPGTDEQVLYEFRDSLQGELGTLTGDVRRIESSLASADCEAVESDLEGRLALRREAYEHTLEQVQAAESRLAALQRAPLPERAAVDPAARRRAVLADVEVQQDLKALRVQLAEGRQSLLRVRESVSPVLADLAVAAERMKTLCALENYRKIPPKLRRVVERVSTSESDYRAALGRFSEHWAAEFTRIESLEDDPGRAELIELQSALQDGLSGFLFETSMALTTMRGDIRVLGPGGDLATGYHELASSLVRGFHMLQNAHHRFEFAAADVKCPNNFRLDAALKSSRGLRHRSRKRLNQIEERLGREALAALQAEREAQIATLTEEVKRLRPTLDRAVRNLLGTHEQADEHDPVVRDFQQSKTVAGVYEERIRQLRAELARIETRLNDLAAKRMDVINPDHLRLVPQPVSHWPVNLMAKLMRGLLAAVAALGVVTLIQLRWAPRRR